MNKSVPAPWTPVEFTMDSTHASAAYNKAIAGIKKKRNHHEKY